MRLGGGSRYQIFPSLVPSDTVVCATPRALETSFVMATKNQRILYASYEGFSALTLLNSFPVRLAAPIHDVLVINDLSEHSGLLLVNKRGGFTLMKGVWDRGSTPTEAAVFTACFPPPRGGWIDLRTVYHGPTRTLFYGGPIGASGATEIHGFHVAEEQIAQRLEVPGNPSLTCLSAHLSQRALLAGFADGVVRYYDDRQRQGGVSAVAALPAAEDAIGGGEAVLGVGPIAMTPSSTFSIAAMTRHTLCLFDTRKLNQPALRMDVRALLNAGEDGGAGGGGGGALPFITCGAVGLYTGLIGLGFSDDSYAAFNPKGRILTEGRIYTTTTTATTSSSAEAATNAPLSRFPRSFISHPLRPLLSFGGDLMFFHL
ncbi:unnamed protein product [Phytomonas sp. EM1]|nr:unnamed protein product [Phytomonas sp. EM1]|eukprot:CCW63430.1 unnamed protein product [Phytomonas sp. isolate EM1]